MLFAPDRLSLGIVLPMQSREQRDVDLAAQLALARQADELGFAALWLRDVPLNSPGYPDPIGHSDPWVLAGALAAVTKKIEIVTGAIVLPLRHPLHVAKAALSLNDLSGGRFTLGLGSGDRPPEYELFGRGFEIRKELFRDNWQRVAAALRSDPSVLDEAGQERPDFELLPRVERRRVPMIAVGSSGQSLEWIARNAEGWATYHREFAVQKDRIALWKNAVAKSTTQIRSFSQAMALHLLDDPKAPAETAGLGYRTGRLALVDILKELREAGVSHVMFNIGGGRRPVPEVLSELASDILPFSSPRKGGFSTVPVLSHPGQA